MFSCMYSSSLSPLRYSNRTLNYRMSVEILETGGQLSSREIMAEEEKQKDKTEQRVYLIH